MSSAAEQASTPFIMLSQGKFINKILNCQDILDSSKAVNKSIKILLHQEN